MAVIIVSAESTSWLRKQSIAEIERMTAEDY